MIYNISQHVNDYEGSDAEKHAQRDHSLRILHLAGRVAYPVPAHVGKYDQHDRCGHMAPWAQGSGGRRLGAQQVFLTLEQGKPDDHQGGQAANLEYCRCPLINARCTDANIVEGAKNKNNRQRNQGVCERAHFHKVAEIIGGNNCQTRSRTGPDNEELRPTEHETSKRAEAALNVDIFSAGIGKAGSQFRINQPADKNKYAGHDPQYDNAIKRLEMPGNNLRR